jgi:hypothetical protein
VSLKIILKVMTVAWFLGVAMIFYYSDVIGPGVYMSGAMVAITWAVGYFMG